MFSSDLGDNYKTKNLKIKGLNEKKYLLLQVSKEMLGRMRQSDTADSFKNIKLIEKQRFKDKLVKNDPNNSGCAALDIEGQQYFLRENSTSNHLYCFGDAEAEQEAVIFCDSSKIFTLEDS
ncbi:MAG: hypothetical protein MHMPM18_000628 [Marteilia pararefringens]